jgi:hypothetical protein
LAHFIICHPIINVKTAAVIFPVSLFCIDILRRRNSHLNLLSKRSHFLSLRSSWVC